MNNAFEQNLEAAVRAHADLSDGSHDMSHMRRVKRIALEIAKAEGQGDTDVLIAAAYLHDLVSLPKSDPNRSKASAMSAKAARPIMAGLGMAEGSIANACHAIEAHSFSAGVPAKTIEAKILQDADRFDALGAIGISRVFYISGTMKRSLFDGDDPFAQARELDDTNFALDHFEVKLFKLPAMMQTVSGRTLAEERVAFMRQFIDQIRGELVPGS